MVFIWNSLFEDAEPSADQRVSIRGPVLPFEIALLHDLPCVKRVLTGSTSHAVACRRDHAQFRLLGDGVEIPLLSISASFGLDVLRLRSPIIRGNALVTGRFKDPPPENVSAGDLRSLGGYWRRAIRRAVYQSRMTVSTVALSKPSASRSARP